VYLEIHEFLEVLDKMVFFDVFYTRMAAFMQSNGRVAPEMGQEIERAKLDCLPDKPFYFNGL
jgi:hypothetical protein